MPIPAPDDRFDTKSTMLQDITVSLGGRIAEDLIMGDITTGAYQDIKQATAKARAMVTEFGMSDELGIINYSGDNEEVFVGRDFGTPVRPYGDAVADKIDAEVKRIVDECYANAKAIIEEHRSVLDSCAELLLEKEKITGEEFEALFNE